MYELLDAIDAIVLVARLFYMLEIKESFEIYTYSWAHLLQVEFFLSTDGLLFF